MPNSAFSGPVMAESGSTGHWTLPREIYKGVSLYSYYAWAKPKPTGQAQRGALNLAAQLRFPGARCPDEHSESDFALAAPNIREVETKCESKEAIKMEQTNTGNQPEKKFRAGAISATVWLNQGQSKTGEPRSYRTISLQRGYKDNNDEWKNTSSMRVNDLPRAALMLTKAYEYLVTMQRDDTGAPLEPTTIPEEPVL